MPAPQTPLPPAPDGPQYAVVVPVKPPSVGKSRLRGLDDGARRSLAAAFALDTVAACLAARSVGHVLVVTDDAFFSSRLGALGAESIPDAVTEDLNGTLRQAAADARRRWPGLVPVAVCADLPALRPEDLDDVLAAADPGRPRFVADADGVGTTVYVGAHDEFDPRFGPGSRAAHLDTGALEVATAAASVRRDVDSVDDLRTALALGAGPRTTEAAGALDLDATTGRHPLG